MGISVNVHGGRGAVLGEVERRALDLHEVVSDAAAPQGCQRASKTLRLRSESGALAPVRCRATNQCDYCARLSAVEWSEMLALDAMEGEAPRVWMVLTTRSTEPDPAAFYESRRQVMRAIKRRYPLAEYVCIVEFTTGYGSSSGGARRPHWNVLVKGVPPDACAELERIVSDVWCAREDALPAAQFVGGISEVGGLMRYIALHFLKESQRPPRNWGRKQRVTASRGYFTTPRWRLREQAQRALRLKRELWRVEGEGLAGSEALLLAEARQVKAEGVRWELVAVSVDHDTGEIARVRPLHGGEVRTARLRRSLPCAVWYGRWLSKWQRDAASGDRPVTAPRHAIIPSREGLHSTPLRV